MDVTPLVRANQKIIQSYANGQFRVSGDIYEGALFVLPEICIPWTVSGTFTALSKDDFAPLIARAPEIDVVLLGCGEKIAFLPLPLRTALKSENLNIDVMDTGAACRTYNVLMAEGRRVATALLPYT